MIKILWLENQKSYIQCCGQLQDNNSWKSPHLLERESFRNNYICIGMWWICNYVDILYNVTIIWYMDLLQCVNFKYWFATFQYYAKWDIVIYNIDILVMRSNGQNISISLFLQWLLSKKISFTVQPVVHRIRLHYMYNHVYVTLWWHMSKPAIRKITLDIPTKGHKGHQGVRLIQLHCYA